MKHGISLSVCLLVVICWSCSWVSGSAAEVVTFHLEKTDDGGDAMPYTSREGAPDGPLSGFCTRHAVLARPQIQSMKMVAREFGAQPTWGIDLVLAKDATAHLAAIPGDSRLLIFVDEKCAVATSMKSVRDKVSRSLILFIPLPQISLNEVRVLEAKIKEWNRTGKP